MSAAAIGLIAVVIAVAVVVGFVATRARRKKVARTPPYIVALNALVDGDEPTAIRQLKNAVRLDSSNVDAYLRLGDLFRRRGEAERALHLHRELALRERIDKADRARVQHALCRDYIALRRFDKAAEAARDAIKLSDEPGEAMSMLLEVTAELGDIDGAFRVKKDLARRQGRGKAGGDLAEFRAGQGEALLEQGELREAERVLKDARRLDHGNARARRAWGLLRERQGDYAGAIDAWGGLLEAGAAGVEELFRDLEGVRFLHGSFSDMESAYRRFLEEHPGHAAAAFGLARFLRRKGQHDEALDVCRQGLHANVDSHELRVLQLALLLQSGRAAEAEAALNEWLVSFGEESAAGGHAHLVESETPS